LAKALRIPRVLVPNLPGALSALGILLADTVRDYSKTVMAAAPADVEPYFRELEASANAEFFADHMQAVASRSLDLRYAGQGYELNIPAGTEAVAQFHAAHRRRYGYADESRPIEVVNVRLRMTMAAAPMDFPKSDLQEGNGRQAILDTRPVIFEGASFDTPVYDRQLLLAGERFIGPAIVVEYSATTVVPPGFQTTLDTYKNLIIEVK
jgi:N-methylhydantoinase A